MNIQTDQWTLTITKSYVTFHYDMRLSIQWNHDNSISGYYVKDVDGPFLIFRHLVGAELIKKARGIESLNLVNIFPRNITSDTQLY